MKISFNSEIDFSEWDRLTECSLFHTRKWISIIADSYGLTPFYAMANSGESYALIAACKVGSKYISLPHTHVTGFLSNSKEASDALQHALVSNNYKIRYKQIENCLPDSKVVNSLIEIPNLESYWNSLSSNMRNQIKKSRRQEGFVFCEHASISEFYTVLSKNMHVLGTPVHSINFYRNISERLETCRVYSVRYNGAAVAVMFGLYANDLIDHSKRTFYNLWASSLPEFDKIYANYFLYWCMLERVASDGVHLIDLGTSISGSGVYRFKQKFNAKSFAVSEYEVGNAVALMSYKQTQMAKYLSQLWSMLPYALTLHLGPVVRKYLV